MNDSVVDEAVPQPEPSGAPGAERPGKRERLIAGAADLLHRRGAAVTTLAEVAQHADVPPGNVYYYFKTKDDLIRAVIEGQVEQVHAQLAAFDADAGGPAAALKSLVGMWDAMRDIVSRYGCPFGTLTTELDKRGEGLDIDAARPLQLMLEWAEGHFAALGHADARDRAEALLVGVQGSAVMAGAFREPDLVSREVARLKAWIDAPPEPPTSGR